MDHLLSTINSPQNLQKLSYQQLTELATEMRRGPLPTGLDADGPLCLELGRH